ncbi:hypothetical protein NOVOSPHI9U_260043 [Novosphingobium sp. 9U]|nr:hypothetical protein NOVOSPHI9U_260043 [Novosphingobium sp. 9U]
MSLPSTMVVWPTELRSGEVSPVVQLSAALELKLRPCPHCYRSLVHWLSVLSFGDEPDLEARDLCKEPSVGQQSDSAGFPDPGRRGFWTSRPSCAIWRRPSQAFTWSALTSVCPRRRTPRCG